MRRTRARLLACAVVIAAASAAYAFETWAPTPQSNASIGTNQPGRIVFSIRNTGAGMLEVYSWNAIGMAGTSNGCSQMNAPAPLFGFGSATIPPFDQVQFIVTTNGYATESDHGCIWEAQTNPALQPPLQVPVTFLVRAAPSIVDLQPSQLQFGMLTTPDFATQGVRVSASGPTANYMLAIENDPTNNFFIDSPCTDAKTCQVSVPGMGSAAASAMVKCVANGMGGAKSAMLLVKSVDLATTYGSASLLCTVDSTASDITLQDDTLEIMSMPGITGMATTQAFTTAAPTQLSFVSVSGSNFGLTNCGGAMSCSPNLDLPQSITVTCAPAMTQTQTTLYVEEPGGDSDMAIVYCTPTGVGPNLYVNPTTMAFGSLAVGATGGNMLHLRNDGDVTLTNITIAFPGTNGSHWNATGCTSGQPCTLAVGEERFVTINFAPTSHGNKSTMASVSSDQTTSTPVDLSGIGLGGVMEITSPPLAQPPLTGYHLQLGTIPRGQMTSAPIVVRNTGNTSIDVSVGSASAPYTITPPSPVSVGSNMEQTFTVTCGSDTASANNDQVFSVTSNAYLGSNQSVAAHCAIADTLVQIDPLAFQFGELRTNGGSQTKTMIVTVTTPSTATTAARLYSMQLRETRPGLTLAPPATDKTLQPGESTTAMLTLDNAQETDLAGQFLDIRVDGAMLELPVTGKVVTASSRVVPETRLDLGTACVGTQVTGNVMLINDGTATLGVEPPQMDASFTANAPNVTTLPPDSSLTAAVSPAMSTSGPISGTLTWRSDVPNTHAIEVVLDYVASGTAVSPRDLDFGVVEVDAQSQSQRIELQNCELGSTPVAIESLRTKGGPLSAWTIQPAVGYATRLAGREQQAITVTFVPPGRGRYEAELTLRTQNGKQVVHLLGDATGRDFDSTSFYACACNGPGAPSRGWPVALAFVFVIGRRRRGSS